MKPTVVSDAAPAGSGGPVGRATWHRRVAVLPLAYLVMLVAVTLVHPVLPGWRWLGMHLLLLGVATNAIVIWSAHFTSAVLRSPAPASRHGEGLRLTVLNLGVVGVLASGVVGRPWIGVTGAGLVFAAIAAHLVWLVARLRAALPARFTVTVHHYLAATGALLIGIPVGAWMLVVDDDSRPRLLLFHAHVNLLGWVTLTVLGTLLTLWPTVLRTRMADSAGTAARRGLPTAIAGLTAVGIGVLAWWPALAVGGLALTATAVLLTAVPAGQAARQKTPASFPSWSITAAAGWLLVALGVDAWTLLSAPDPAGAADRFGAVLVPFLIGFVGQVLLGALAYLLPMALGGGPARVRERTARLDRHWPQRLAMTNAALAVFVLPTPPYVRITTSLLLLAALLQFLVPAGHVLLASRRQP
ncbi:hypothetical protein [Micromonospora lutea]|uniref:Copper oxidase n=1 Tax=Micromonospora lutea TaxID=419825 RepID=A0ABQ4IYJ1_9ACTN|nr:hypothetical protein [Micromonospora lutea]GIJ23007.1 hypothetical protein Vlu01_36310 [Micromonospora lutea]